MTNATNRSAATMSGDSDKVVDLFSGAGGLTLGAARAGFSVCCAVELDCHAAATHRRNFPETLHIEEDVSRLTGRRLNGALGLRTGELAGIVGGPPVAGVGLRNGFAIRNRSGSS